MDRNEKLSRLRSLLKQIAPDHAVESLERAPAMRAGAGFEALEGGRVDEGIELAHKAVRKIAQETPNERVQDAEIEALEAIVLPRERPVVFIQNGTYATLPDPWSHFADDAIRQKIVACVSAIGRVELPDNPRIPYGGTGFVVGPNLLMTNRHVAEIFTNGLGQRGLTFRSGQTSALNFKREKGDPEDERSAFVRVREIVMIHPFWDMALLRVESLPPGVTPLALSILSPEELAGREIAVVGYPARDDRNDLALQDRIFERTYHVKRLHPGKIRVREKIRSFENSVSAVTHDSSTLGGNSGSAIIDVLTGEIVGLHFAGIYLKANYAVPTYELARDSRVVNAGVNFKGSVRPTDEWAAAWRLADAGESATRPPAAGGGAASPAVATSTVAVPADGQTARWTVPLHVSVSLGAPTMAAPFAAAAAVAPAAALAVEAMREPIVFGNLEERTGYQADFLELADGAEVAIPELTAAGKRVAVKQDNGSAELKYHKFSVVMHKKRRLAIFTAANVDWREESRLINGSKPTRKQLTGLGPNDIERWVTDERIPDGQQLPDLFFTKDGGAFDKGHLVRRDDVCWGETFEDIQMANGDTYHTTNCSPQVSSFNQSARGEDNWGDLENLVQKQTKAEKVMIFSGPVLADDDPVFVGRDKRGDVRIQIPRSFWKIIVAPGAAGPEAFGFVLEQDISAVPTELVIPSEWKTYMRSIADIERLLNGLAKLTELKRIDQFETTEGRSLAETVRRR